MNRKQTGTLAAVTLVIGVYLILFSLVELPSLRQVMGGPWRRVDCLWFLLMPEEFFAAWFGSPGQLSLLDRLPVLLIADFVMGVAVAVGWLLMGLCDLRRGLTRLEVCVFSTAVGLSLLSTYTLALGLAGLLGQRWLFWGPGVAVLVVAAWRYGQTLKSDSRTPAIARTDSETETLRLGWLWLGAPFLLVIVLGGLLPPIEFDVREYHLQVPKEFFEQGQVVFLPHNLYGNMAMGTEMLSLLGMVLTGDWWLGALVGKTVICLFAPLTSLALFAAGRRLISPAAGIVAAILYLSIPWVIQVSTLGLVEGAAACYLFLATYAMILWWRQVGRSDSEEKNQDSSGETCPRPMRLVFLAGYLAGAATAVKYPGLLFVVLPLMAVIPFVYGRRHIRTLWKPVVVYGLAVTLGCGLWFGKNWVLAGNPTYPLMYTVFGGETWTPEKNDYWNHVHKPSDFSVSAAREDLSRVLLRSEWLSPLLLPLAALAFFDRRNRRLYLVLAAYFSFVIVAWWFTALRIDRYWIPALPLIALMAGGGAFWHPSVAWRKIMLGLLILTSAANLLIVTTVAGGDNRYFVSLEQLRVDPIRVDRWHLYFNAQGEGTRVLMVGDAEVFDLEVPVLYNAWVDDSIFETLVKDRSPEEVKESLSTAGVTHVFVHWGEIVRYRATEYGRTDFVQPELFEGLVDEGVLEPIPMIEGHPGWAYRFLASAGEAPLVE